MAKLDTELYKRVRSLGLRKSVARDVAGAARRAGGGKKGPQALRSAVTDLRSLASELEDRAKGGPGRRKAAATKAAQTRKRKQTKRSQAAKKAAKTRAKSA